MKYFVAPVHLQLMVAVMDVVLKDDTLTLEGTEYSIISAK
jgi:hypothetical protein